jgi:hypothetical protein
MGLGPGRRERTREANIEIPGSSPLVMPGMTSADGVEFVWTDEDEFAPCSDIF